MAQNLEEIAEILNSIKKDNKSNQKGIEKVLGVINEKLDMIADDDEAIDVIKMHISELKNVFEKEYSFSSDKFVQIETILGALENKLAEIDNNSIDKDEMILFIASVRDNFADISQKALQIEDNFVDTANTNFENIKNIVEALSCELKTQYESHKDDCEQKDEQNKAEMKSFGANIQLLGDALLNETEKHKKIYYEGLEELKLYFNTERDAFYELNDKSEERLKEKLENLERIHQSFEASLFDVNLNIQSILKNLMTMDPTSQNDILMRELENIYLTSNGILSSLKIFDQKNDELHHIVTDLITQDNFDDFRTRIDAVVSNLNNLSEQVSILPSKGELENLVKGVDKYSSNFDGMSANISELIQDLSNVSDGVNAMAQNYSEIEHAIANVADNVGEVSERIDTYKPNFNNIESELSVISKDVDNINEKIESFDENFSQMKAGFETVNANIERIGINSLSEDVEIISNKFKNLEKNFENISSDINSAAENLKETSAKNYENVISDLNDIKSAIERCEKNTSEGFDFDEMHSDIQSMLLNIDDVKSAIERCEKNTSEGFDFDEMHSDIQSMLSNIDDVKNTIDSVYDKQEKDLPIAVDNIKNAIGDVSTSLYEIKDELIQNDALNSAAVIETFNEVYERTVDLINNNTETANANMGFVEHNLNEITEKLSVLDIDLKSISDKNAEKIIECIENIRPYEELSLDKIKELGIQNVEVIREYQASLIEEHKEYVENIIEGLRGYISEISAAIDRFEPQKNDDEKSYESLIRIEDLISKKNKDNDEKLAILQSSLNTYVETVEKNSIDTDLKLADSLTEIEGIKTELASVLDVIKESNINLDERLVDIISAVSEVSELSSIPKEPPSFEINFDIIDEKFEGFLREFSEIKNNSAEQSAQFFALEEQLEAIKQQISLINTDITDTLKSKDENVEISFEPLKEEIKSFFDSSIQQLSDEIKHYASEVVQNIPEPADFEEFKFDSEAFFNEIKTYLDGSFNIDETIFAIGELKKTVLSAYKKSSDKFADIAQKIDSASLQSLEKLNEINEKLDVLAESEVSFDLGSINEAIAAAGNLSGEKLDIISSKLDIIAGAENDVEVDFEPLNEKLEELLTTDGTMTESLLSLHQKIDAMVFMENDDDDLTAQIDDIRNLIEEQKDFIGGLIPDEKISNIESMLNNAVSCEDLRGIKDSILAAIAAIFDQISFVEESEDIKDFVEVKTDEINQSLIEVTNQLKKIASTDSNEYSYTLQDVESDIAKLRLLLNDMSNSDNDSSLETLSENINKITESMHDLSANLTQEQMYVLKDSFEKLSEDVLSISTRTNKLLLTSDESYQALSSGLDQFSTVIYNLESRINDLDNTEISERIEKKIDGLNTIVTSNSNSDKVFHQVLMYLGEWVDGTTEKIDNITEKLDLYKSLEVKFENRFEEQQLRMDRLESKLDKILSVLEEKDDTRIIKKVEKVEKQVSQLGSNIAKLTSYVDEG